MKSSPYIPVAIVAFLVFLAAWKNLFIGGLVPLDGNMLRLGFPHWALFRAATHAPGRMVWNSYANMGEPFLADPQSMAAYPVMWMLSPLKGFLSFMQGWVLLHTLIAVAFMGLLAHRWTKDRTAALAAGLIYGLNGFITARASLPNHFASAAYLPMMLYFLEMDSAAGFGIATALQWTSGFPPFSYVSVCLAGGLALRKKSQGLRCFFKGGLWALGLSAVQWIPFLEMLRLSNRHLFLNPDAALEFSLSGRQLLKEVFLPQWYALRPGMTGDPAIVCFYVGPLAMGLAFAAAVWGKARERLLAGAVAGLFLLSLGTHLPGYRYATWLHLFRYPANWLLGATLGIALLAASGLRLIKNRSWKRAALIVLVLDLLGFAQYTRTAWFPASFLQERPVLAQQRQPHPFPTRLYHAAQLDAAWTKQEHPSADDYVIMKDLMFPSYGTAFEIPEARSYQVLRSKRAEMFQERLRQAGPSSPLWNEAGISTVVQLAPHTLIVDRAHIQIFENKHPFPPLYLEGSARGKITPLKVLSGTMEAAVDLEKPGRLVFREMFYPGWTATLDQAKMPLTFFEDTFMAIAVPAGVHHVQFHYAPSSFQWGRILSVLTLCLLLLLPLRRRV